MVVIAKRETAANKESVLPTGFPNASEFEQRLGGDDVLGRRGGISRHNQLTGHIKMGENGGNGDNQIQNAGDSGVNEGGCFGYFGLHLEFSLSCRLIYLNQCYVWV
jgi:hypothetical protein